MLRCERLGLRMLAHRLTNRTDLLKQDLERRLQLVKAPTKPGENKDRQEAKPGEELRVPDELDYWGQTLWNRTQGCETGG